MRRLPLRAVLVSLIALVAIGGVFTAVANPMFLPRELSAKQTGACVDSGVTLVIDFGAASEKETVETCVKNFSGTGWALFKAAGFQVEGTSEYPQSFVCRIADWPTHENQDCSNTPSFTDGSWKYFHADLATGNGWVTSGTGAAMHSPACGSFEGWLFVSGDAQQSSRFPRIDPAPFKCE